jgi:hypothetical protein
VDVPGDACVHAAMALVATARSVARCSGRSMRVPKGTRDGGMRKATAYASIAGARVALPNEMPPRRPLTLPRVAAAGTL